MSGPQSKYAQQYHDDWAWSLAIKGATDEEMAEAFGVTRKTLWNWRQAHESLEAAIQQGKYIADSKVEKSLYLRATGFTVTETEETLSVDAEGNSRPTRRKTVSKNIAPDTTAIVYWLNNRKRGQWTQKQQVELNIPDDTPDVVIYLPEIEKDDSDG